MSAPIPFLPPGKKAAVYFSIDDIHPSVEGDPYDAGGSMDKGPLGHVKWLHERHPKLRTTLFVTADWREILPVPTRKLLAKIPVLKDKMFLTPIRAKGERSLVRFPEFVEYLNDFERVECGYHGLHHIHKGEKIPVEFQNQTENEFYQMIKEMKQIFNQAGLQFVPGICPPGWNCPENLVNPLVENGVQFVASARDIFTPVSAQAKSNMSGLKNVSLLYPQKVFGERLIHFPSNFHATNPIDRAFEIIEAGGVLGVKAHIIKQCGQYVAFDGLDELYRNYLDLLFSQLEQKFGDSLWWTSMGEMAEFIRKKEQDGSH